MAGLIFQTRNIQRELNMMSDLASPFLSRDGREKLKVAGNALVSLVKRGGGIWEIPQNDTLDTIVSSGRYETGGRGKEKKSLYGRMSFRWEVVPLSKGAQISVNGLASNQIEIIDPSKAEQRGAIFHFDVSNEGGAVGPKLHVQLPEDYFGMPIPRLHSPIFHPVDCLDFILGELFVDDWPNHLRKEGDKRARVAKPQSKRLNSLYSSSLTAIDGYSDLTALQSLKHWQPEPDIFL